MIKNPFSYLPLAAQYQLSHCLPNKYFESLCNLDKYTLTSFYKLKCIFIHIPKTGGVSIKKALFGKRGGGHKTATEYKKIFGPNIYQNYFSFAYIRNPYSRLISAYTFLKKGGLTKWDQAWAIENLSDYDCFADFVSDWLSSENVRKHKHFIPQHYWICENEIPQVSYIGRFERIQEDFNSICAGIGIETTLSHENNTQRERNIIKFYDKKSKDKVARIYKKDFDIFGYDVDNLRV